MRCMLRPMETGPDLPTPPLVTVGEWDSFDEADEHALVVLAMERDSWIEAGEGTYRVLASPGDAPAIRREFALYAEEQAERRERVELPLFPAGVELMLLWIIALTAAFMVQERYPAFTGDFCNSSRALVERGEWWRPFTALFLHADGGHLLSNIGIGGIFCVMVAHTVGAWRAWLLILASGTLGNALNAWLRYPSDFASLGASTATFGALGVLTGAAASAAWRFRSPKEFRPLVAPIFAGAMMLGMYGVGGEGIDVSGHFAGWACGAVLGVLGARKLRPEVGDEREKAAFAGS